MEPEREIMTKHYCTAVPVTDWHFWTYGWKFLQTKSNKSAADPVTVFYRSVVQIIKGETWLQAALALHKHPVVNHHPAVKCGSRHETQVVGFTLRPLWPWEYAPDAHRTGEWVGSREKLGAALRDKYLDPARNPTLYPWISFLSLVIISSVQKKIQ